MNPQDQAIALINHDSYPLAHLLFPHPSKRNSIAMNVAPDFPIPIQILK
jgi:hypothetical protein